MTPTSGLSRVVRVSLDRPVDRCLIGVLTAVCALQVLHSSVDLDSCMAAIMATPTGVSTVVLSTNVGESSITVPRATLVLDLCLHLEVTWDHRTDGTTPRMVWCSQSQAEQRKGRVGRCQDGRAIRLLPSAAYHKLRQHEASAIEIGSLRNVALALFTTARPCRPLQVLDGCLTPPARERVSGMIVHSRLCQPCGFNVETVPRSGGSHRHPFGAFQSGVVLQFLSCYLFPTAVGYSVADVIVRG